MKNVKLIALLLFAVLITGCADVSPHVEMCVTSNPYGFWGGAWHGMILMWSFIGSLFSDDIAIYMPTTTMEAGMISAL